MVSLLPESHRGFLAWLMKALLIDPWVSCPGVVSCHHRLCPLSSRVSSLHHDFSFIENVIVTFHFCFTLSSLRSGTITPLSKILSNSLSSGLTWHMGPWPHIDLTWVTVCLLVTSLLDNLLLKSKYRMCLSDTSLSPIPSPLALGSRAGNRVGD